MQITRFKKKASWLLLEAVLLTLLGSMLSCTTSNTQETDTPPLNATNTETEKENTDMSHDGNSANEKTIDLYLIAGQSNATGCTKIQSAAAAYEWAYDLNTGFSNVHYAGNSRSNGAEPRDRVLEWQETTIGLGITAYHFGPEAGMAKAFSTYYNPQTGRNAGMIKYAYGGANLLNVTTGSTAKDGNWVSPSYQKTLPAEQVVSNVTGQMYRNFLEQVEKNVSELVAYGGYTSVRICGLYWMQGCADKYNPTEYEIAFKYFAKDVRNDLSAIMKRYTNSDDDCGASKMPIIVGTISQTQNLINADTEAINIAFIKMQKGLSSKIESCYVLDNSAYRITSWTNNQQVILGSDQWHWNQADMLEIGNNVGKAMLYCAKITSTDPFPTN